MPGILPSASNHPVWSPIAAEIHAVIWDRVGLENVQGFVREWASNWLKKFNLAESSQKESLARVRQQLHYPDYETLPLIANNLPYDLQMQQAIDAVKDWQPLLPELPLPPSPHRQRSPAEKWASLAALHDVYDLTGDTVLPWPLPEDDLDLVAYAKWIRGEAGMYQLLMRKAFVLPPDCEQAIHRWLTDVSKDTPPKATKSEDRRSKSKGKNKEPFDRTLFDWLKLYHEYGSKPKFHNRPIGCREFEKWINEHPGGDGYKTNATAVSRFFKSAFGSHRTYKLLCGEEENETDVRALEMKFELLNGDTTNEGLLRLAETRISDRPKEAELDFD